MSSIDLTKVNWTDRKKWPCTYVVEWSCPDCGCIHHFVDEEIEPGAGDPDGYDFTCECEHYVKKLGRIPESHIIRRGWMPI